MVILELYTHNSSEIDLGMVSLRELLWPITIQLKKMVLYVQTYGMIQIHRAWIRVQTGGKAGTVWVTNTTRSLVPLRILD